MFVLTQEVRVGPSPINASVLAAMSIVLGSNVLDVEKPRISR